MNPDDIERALSEDEKVRPRPDFTARVMRAVREEATDLGPIGFPWLRVLPGVIVGTAAIIAAAVIGPPATAPTVLDDALSALPMDIIGVTLAPLLGSWLVVRLSLRLAGVRS